MKKILITNDDGFESEGLHVLARAMRKIGHVTIVAPTTEKSACGHSLTLTRPLRFVEIEDHFFKLDDGTPTDCIYLALNALFDEKNRPDLVVSGINIGANLGEDITYSGTASAAMEAVLQGIPAIAFSQVYKGDFENLNYDLAEEIAYELALKVLNKGFPLEKRRFLNVNIPLIAKKDFKGYKVVKAGTRLYGNEATIYRSPRGVEYHWIGLPSYKWQLNESKDCDLSAVQEGFVSITPVHLDMTAYDELKSVSQWIE